MIIEKSMSQSWLSNAWLVGDGPGGHAVFIDSGAPLEPLLAAVEENRLQVTHLLCTHHHGDHVAHNAEIKERYGVPVVGSRAEARRFSGGLDRELDDGGQIVSGDLRIRALLTPGHTEGMLAFVVDEERVFTGDTLFRGSVGGTTAPGHAGFEDLKHSVMEVLMQLPEGMPVHPGHTDDTTIGREWEENPFIRLWRGLDEPGSGRCEAMGRPAELVLRARDYDGGTKCWVRYADGSDEVVPGSRVVDVD